jgi:hypothetical protein
VWQAAGITIPASSKHPLFTMDTPSSNQPYTIVRIKRKRTDEPLDALGMSVTHVTVHERHLLIMTLVVESGARRKKSRGGRDVFQFVQTVEETVWEDKRLQETLQVSWL